MIQIKWSNSAILFLAAGIYLAIGAIAGYMTVNALVLLLLGVERYRWDRSRLAIGLMVAATVLLIVSHFALFALVVLLSLGIYYFRSKPYITRANMNKHRLVLNLRHDEQSWLMQSMSYWHAVGEIRLDMSLAVPEEKMTSIVLQGLIGDLDLIVPEDCGLQVEASVLLGQISFKQTTEGGVLHRLSWKSPDYEQCEQQLKLNLFYLIGDIKIRTV